VSQTLVDRYTSQATIRAALNPSFFSIRDPKMEIPKSTWTPPVSSNWEDGAEAHVEDDDFEEE
jgi:hypothetical protein